MGALALVSHRGVQHPQLEDIRASIVPGMVDHDFGNQHIVQVELRKDQRFTALGRGELLPFGADDARMTLALNRPEKFEFGTGGTKVRNGLFVQYARCVDHEATHHVGETLGRPVNDIRQSGGR